MIRPLRAPDIAAVADLGVSAGLFPPEARDFLADIARAVLGEEREGRWLVDTDGDKVVGCAFFEPREATDRVWYLTMLAVAPEARSARRGQQLVAAVEGALRAEDQRLLLIETSATPAFASSRSFYARCGYTEVARVPDYFEDGDDMVLFRKDLRL